jgi:hypothetical protein
MYFDGPAARWLQSVESKAQYTDWDPFCKMVHDRFGRDQHEILIRQLFHIHQMGPVCEYIEQFAQLVDQLETYTSITDPMYYTLRFIDGLKDDIKSIVLVQRPKDLDTAFVLASLQEEVGDPHRRRDYRKLEYGFHSKQSSKGLLPLPAPPLRDRQPVQPPVDDSRAVEAARAGAFDSKAAALRSYHRAMGLCYRCSEKWSRDHKCAPIVQLHVVQEVWDALQLEDDGVISPSSDGSSEHVFLAISKAAVTGQVAPRTVKFLGSIQHVPESILVDSGSSTSFVSSKLASRLSGIIPLPKPTSVQVAGGGLLSCSALLAQAIWFIGDLPFQSDLRVLPLAAYDIIVGMDWLECYSPMRVHWKRGSGGYTAGGGAGLSRGGVGAAIHPHTRRCGFFCSPCAAC